jgi:hypothetical protein
MGPSYRACTDGSTSKTQSFCPCGAERGPLYFYHGLPGLKPMQCTLQVPFPFHSAFIDNAEGFLYYACAKARLIMAKSRDIRKDVKKKPSKSIKEKKKAKLERKSK